MSVSDVHSPVRGQLLLSGPEALSLIVIILRRYHNGVFGLNVVSGKL
jgi:hypothetical protein